MNWNELGLVTYKKSSPHIPNGKSELKIPPSSVLTIEQISESGKNTFHIDYSEGSERLEIKSVDDELIFECSGSWAVAKITRSECDGNMEFTQKPDNTKVIQGEFS